MKILIILPTYNERDNIANLIISLFSVNQDLHVLVVDDSNDGTDQVIVEMQGQHPNLFLVKRTTKNGRGSAVLEGLKWGLAKKYDYFVEMDADMSHHPQDLAKLLEKASPDCVVYGSRFVPGARIGDMSAFRKIFSRCANLFARVVLQVGLHDPVSGYRVYPRAIVSRANFFSIKPSGYSVQFETSYRLFQHGVRFVEVPITFINRKRGESKFSFQEIMESFLSVLKIRWRRDF